MDKRINYYPFKKEVNVLMAYMYRYEVRAVPLDGVEGSLSKRLARDVCRLAKHFEARDILLYLMGCDKMEVLQLPLYFNGVNIVELAISELCLKMYEDEWDVHITYPEHKNEIKTRYRFECKFSTLVTE